jgi:putative transposase
MMFPLVRELAVDGVPVAVTCRVLGFTKQAYFKWRAHPVTDRDWDDAHLINAAIDIHHDDPEFGYRFITDELADQGVKASRNRVNRLCTMQRIWSVHSRKRGRHRVPGPPVHDDLVLREFDAAAPNDVWFTDITEHPTAEGKLYLCAIKDACSKRIVGYSIDDRMSPNSLSPPCTTPSRFAAPSGPSSTPTEAVNSGPTLTPKRCEQRSSAGRWAASVPAPTTRRWSPSSHYCRRTSSTGSVGRPANSCGWGSSSGSNAPTTVGAAKTPSADSPRSSSRHCYRPLTRPDRPYP